MDAADFIREENRPPNGRRKKRKRMSTSDSPLIAEAGSSSSSPSSGSSKLFQNAKYRRMGSAWKDTQVKLGSNSLTVKDLAKDKVVDRMWYSDFKTIKIVVAGGSLDHELQVDIRGGTVLHLAASSSEERERWVTALCRAYKSYKSAEKAKATSRK